MPYEWPHEVQSYSNLSIGVSSGISYPPLAIMLDNSKMEVRSAGVCLSTSFQFFSVPGCLKLVDGKSWIVSKHGLSLGKL